MHPVTFRHYWIRRWVSMIVVCCLLFPNFSPSILWAAGHTSMLDVVVSAEEKQTEFTTNISPNTLESVKRDALLACPSPFLYLPFNRPEGWQYPTSYFDHHFPAYRRKAKPTTQEERNCVSNFLVSGLSDDIAVAPPFEFPRIQNNVEKIEKLNDWVFAYYCAECEEKWVWYDGHPGYDWGLPERTPIYASGAGTIIEASCHKYGTEKEPDSRGPEGCSITIRHDSPNSEYTSHYFHLYPPDAQGENVPWPGQNNVPGIGEHVEPSQIIAWSGRTGWNKFGTYTPWAAHLHFEVRHNGHPIDPWGWTPYARDAGDPDSDPLQCYQGEKSCNIFVGYEPHCYDCVLPLQGKVTQYALKSFSMAQLPPTSYLGGSMDSEPGLPSSDHATFLSDLTLPDHTVVSPGASLVKTWRVRNSGTSTWDGYKLIFRSGDQMGAPSSVDIPYTPPDSEVDISIPIVAPQASARGDWQIVNSSGTWVRNGQLWVILDVQGTDPINTTAIDLECLDCPAVVAPGTTFRPTIRAKVTSGQLQGVNLRGDMLRHKSGERYGAYEFIAVPGNTVINPGQTYDFTFYENDPLRAPDQEGDYETTWQVWRDNNWAGEEYTIHFKVRNGGSLNHPPNRPTLTGPGDWAVYQGTQPVLTAQHNGDPDGDAVNEYYFDIFESAQNANSGWISSNSWSPQGLGYNGYQWRAKVRDGNGNESDWSEQTWHFNILNNAAEIYDFHSETCREAWGGSEKVCFCADTNAGTLRVQINTANDGSTNGEWRVINELGVPDYPCASDSDRPPNLDPLPFESGTHVVRLYARREGGWENAAYRDITLNLAAERKPNTPSLQQPQWRTYVNALNVHFNWDETLRTNSYHLEASDTSDYSNLLVDQTFAAGITEYDYTFTTDYTTVYWRVTATGPYGSNPGRGEFYFDLTPPTSSMTTLPPVTIDTKFTVNWAGNDARAGIRWYHIQVRDTSRLDSMWEDWLVNTTKTAEMFQGQSGHTYAFRVRAMDNIGNWEDWPTGDGGDTLTRIDPSAALPTAWWNADYAEKRNLVILNNDNDAMPVDFPIHIHFDDTTTPSASEIYNASLAAVKGDDVRSVYDNQTEIHRFVQRFTPGEIDLWFPLQNSIGGGQTNTGDYQIYYGYAGASNPPADINTVFLPKVDGNTMGLWHFQDGSGSTVADTSGRNHTGAFQNAAWADGYLGYTGNFNGTNAYVEIAHSDDFKPGAITLEAWIYLTGSTGDYPMIFNKDRYWFRIRNDGEAQFMIKADGGDRTATSQTRLAQNRWYHVAATFDGNQRMRIYINGQLDREENNGAPPVLWNSQPLRIGRTDYDGNSYFPGYIHHARISNVERTDFSYARVDIAPSVETGVSITPPGSGAPDLAILDLTTYTNPGGGLLVMAAVQNQGDAPTQNNFYTDLYVNHLPTGAGDYTGTLQFWVNSPIVAGAHVTLTTVITDLGSMGGNLARALATPGTEVTATLYSQVDSAGVISETDNVNNISSGVAICLASADAYEGDDEITGASVIMPSQTQTHNFDSLADRDWVQFTAQGGVTYTLHTFGLGSGADTYLYLYESDGVSLTLLAANDDYGGSLASQIDWMTPATNTYYLLVQHWNPNVGGCGTSYKLSVKVQHATQTVYLPLVLREHDPSAAPQTLRVYSGLDDGEIGNVNCTEWDACRNASFGNLAFSGYANATVESNYYTETETYSIKRLFFSFDTSTVPADAAIQSAVLNIYAGPYQSGSDRRVHVAQSTQASTLTYSNWVCFK